MRRRRSILIVVGFAVAGLACERAREQTAERFVERVIAESGRKSKVEIDEARGSIAVDLGGAIVPEGWPQDVPVYPNARRVRVREKTPDRERLTLSTEDSLAALARFYRAELAALGWKLAPPPSDERVLEARRPGSKLSAAFSESKGRGSRVTIERVRGG